MTGDIRERGPADSPLLLDQTGRRHLLVTDLPLLLEEVALDPALVSQAEIWTIPRGDDIHPGVETHAHGSADDLRRMLERRLMSEFMGLRLYATGTEPFVWSIHALAQRAGMGGHEVRLQPMRSVARMVWCIYCHTVTESASSTHATCRACGTVLRVRDHFSRRLNAYQGLRLAVEALPDYLPEAKPAS